jgi:abort lactococcal phage infection abiTi
MKGYLIMSDFKDIDLSKFSLDLTKTMQYVNPVQDQMARIQREQEQTIRSIQKAREEKEAEELRRHNEIVAALKEAGEKGATIVIGDNANGIQIQQNSDGAMQEMTNSQTFNYDKALEVLKEIKEYIDFPQFQTTFKENSENVKAIIEDTIKAVENKEDVGIVKKSLRILKDLAVGASGSLIASGIIALLGTLPL